jgi:uncharacterized protein YjgD (DUF1641 family)
MTVVPDLDVEERLDLMSRQLELLVVDAEERKELRDSLTELTGDLSPITRQLMADAASALSNADQRGYVDFARSGLGVVDRIVTGFSSDDVEALGDNIVLILDAVKDMTQPEIMGMLRSSLHQVQAEASAEPPSLFSLARRLRDPNVRRGLDRLLVLLEGLGSSEIEREPREKGVQP